MKFLLPSLRIAIGHRLTWNAKKGLLLAAACLFANLTDLKLNLGWMEGRNAAEEFFALFLKYPKLIALLYPSKRVSI